MMDLKIGEFARIGQVSVQTLRYYDDLGLIKPVKVDVLSGYRYYALDQLPQLNQVLALKDLGFSLDQVAHLVQQNPSHAELRRMLELKRSEVSEQIQTELDRLERLNGRLRLMEQADAALNYEVVIKQIPTAFVASVRNIIPSYWDEGPLWNQLVAPIQQLGIEPCAPCISIYHAAEPAIDVEVCAPITAPDRDRLNGSPLILRELPCMESAACTIHHGAFTGLANAFASLLKWLDANHYQVAGPDREVFLRLPTGDPYGDDPTAITELQIPVVRQPAAFSA
jgi:DNA-binding transcriptional MerR regulator